MRLLALLLLVVSQGAIAQTFGGWFVGTGDDTGPYMFTTNDSGNYLGKWCDMEDNVCVWMYLSKTRCESMDNAPVLLNLETGAAAIESTCAGARILAKETFYRSVLHKPDVLDKMMVENESVAIAVALESGNFRVMRFNLQQSKQALKRWQDLLEKATQKPKGTKDRTL